VKHCCELLLDAAQEALSGVDDLLGGSAPLHGTEPRLNIFKNSLERVFRSASYSGSDYKVYISDESPKKSDRYSNSSSVLTSFSNSKKIRTVNYWCFSTGIALMELKSLGIKSFILTSGLLHDSVFFYISQQIDFFRYVVTNGSAKRGSSTAFSNRTAESPCHQVMIFFFILSFFLLFRNNQVCLMSLQKGVNGQKLSSTYVNRDNVAYKV
jgi:hypothetical protein